MIMTTLIKQKGFTLAEVAIVLVIVGLLMGGLLPTLSGQIDERHNTDTTKQLNDIRDALIGFAIINGRLPCPASTSSNGVESPITGTGICDFPYGYVPAATLGLSGTDSSGYAVDAWNNRIRYAVTIWNNYTFTKPNGLLLSGISNLLPNLLVCSTSSGISPTSCNTTALTASPGVPAVIYSTGKNGAQGSAGPDEAANLDNNQTFVSHLPAGNGAPGGYFDDIVIWISPNVLISRMVSAGKLP